jgi:NAD(P)-dependent dehydrogenase (short-subunit alcohol dehydrogenase family)
MFFAGKSEAAVEAGVKSNPFERLGKVEDVAPLVAFLASGLMLSLFGSMEGRFDS